MKILTALLLTLAGIPAFYAINAEAAENLRVIKYDVYPDSARLIFEADSEGLVSVGIPAAFPPENVRPLPSGNGVEIISFKAESSEGDFTAPEFLAAEKKAIDETAAKISALKSDMTGLDLSAVLLDNVNIDGIKAQELDQYIKTASAMRIKTAAEYAAKEKELAALNEKLKSMTQNYEKRLPKNWNSRTYVTALTAGKGKIYFEAATSAAGWVPSYNMALDTASGVISAEMTASVRQATGMIWDGQVEFHSSAPSNGRIPASMPPLVAVIPGKNEPAPRTLSKPYVAAMKSEAGPAASAAPSFSETLLSLNIKTKIYLKGDNAPVTVSLKKFGMKSETVFEAIPAYSDKASLTAFLKAPEALLAGNARLYIDGEYSGTSPIKETEKNGEISIPFGAVKGITVSRTPMIKQTGSSWSKGTLKDGYIIEAVNGLKKEITLKITDRVPVSSDESISVNVNKMSPEPSETAGGVCTWTLKMAPGAEREIAVEYTVKYPEDGGLDFKDGAPGSFN